MTEPATSPGTTAETPLYFRWVRDSEDKINWGRMVLMLGLTVATAYLSVRTQRTASDPDFTRTIKMKLAQREITYGMQIQRYGKAIEEAGWASYEKVRI